MNPNPYQTNPPPGRTETVPFAREVYRTDEPRSPNDELRAAIAALRAEVRTEVRALRAAMNRPKANGDLTGEVGALRADVDALLESSSGAKGGALSNLIRARGIEGSAAAALGRLGKAGGKGRGRGVEERLASAIESMVTVAPWPVAIAPNSLVALVGPAGVGKTTTIAKIGARMRRAGKRVAFVSCDGYRVGAMDQLGRYAELMESEFHAVHAPEELLAVAQRSRADVVLVDTSGRVVEPGTVEAMLGDPRLRDAHHSSRRVEVMLVTPAALRAADAGRIGRGFASTEPTSLCLTKLDETDAPSALLHAPFATKLPLSTLCFGQRVPEDIAPATVAEIVARLVPHGTLVSEPPRSYPPERVVRRGNEGGER